MTDAADILVAEGIHKSYRDDGLSVTVLRDLSLRVKAGEILAVVGASGAGKSTLLHCLGGLDHTDSGSIRIDGRELATLDEAGKCRLRNESLGFVYQFHHLLPEFSAADNVAMPLAIRRVPLGERMARARAALASVGMAHRAEHFPAELSGGERQRAAIARALVTRPRCILADEPTGNLDRSTALGVFELLLSLARDHGSAIVIVTHDPELAARCDRIFQLG